MYKVRQLKKLVYARPEVGILQRVIIIKEDSVKDPIGVGRMAQAELLVSRVD
jgi:hypothetical protein